MLFSLTWRHHICSFQQGFSNSQLTIVQSQKNKQKKVWNMFKINNTNTRTMSICFFVCCFFFLLWTYFTPFASVSIADFEQVKVSWVVSLLRIVLWPVYNGIKSFVSLMDKDGFYNFLKWKYEVLIFPVMYTVTVPLISRNFNRHFGCKFLLLPPIKNKLKVCSMFYHCKHFLYFQCW